MSPTVTSNRILNHLGVCPRCRQPLLVPVSTEGDWDEFHCNGCDLTVIVFFKTVCECDYEYNEIIRRIRRLLLSQPQADTVAV